MKTVYLGMSGGVDSSVSALLLKEQGYNVVGVYMKNWSEDLPGMKCPWAEDLADAKRVAVKLGIDFRVFDFEREYHEKVVDYMLTEFKKGNTPNPDIMCNQEIKFKLFYEKSMEQGADYIATGHYARIKPSANAQGLASQSRSGARRSLPSTEVVRVPRGGLPRGSRATPRFANLRTPLRRDSDATRASNVELARATDENKDQTYFLYRISSEALAHTLFPIGDMLKPDVKKLAEERGLHNAYKKESMGVCFVGEVGMKDFLKEYIDIEPGEIREVETERVLGYHEGAVFYTIGQRHGLYLSGVAGEVNDGLPYYVVAKDIAKNVVYVSKNLNDEHIWTDRLALKDVVIRDSAQGLASQSRSGARPADPSSCLAGVPPVASPVRVDVRLRHRAPLVPAKLVVGENDSAVLEFENKIKRPAAGQSAVIYDGEICLGGGIIA